MSITLLRRLVAPLSSKFGKEKKLVYFNRFKKKKKKNLCTAAVKNITYKINVNLTILFSIIVRYERVFKQRPHLACSECMNICKEQIIIIIILHYYGVPQ